MFSGEDCGEEKGSSLVRVGIRNCSEGDVGHLIEDMAGEGSVHTEEINAVVSLTCKNTIIDLLD